VTLLQALVLGIVQGATEFLPVSSSGHLVLVPWLLGWQLDPGVAFVFDVLVQLGTLAAVIAFLWRDLVSLARAALAGLVQRRPLATAEARLAWLIAVATIPAALAGILFKDVVERAFASPAAVSAFLLLTAALLYASERLGRPRRDLPSLTVADALWVGLAQALALLPGVSRSGATIAGGLGRGLHRPEAARLSFLMSVPVFLGAGLVATRDLAASPHALTQAPPLVVGFVTAAVVGYLAIRWLLAYLARRPLTPFAVYCLLAGVAGLILSGLRG
jgi:undecaprenyl-diphosphatase